MKVKELMDIGATIGRQGLAIHAIDLINNYDGSYKGAIQLCGQLSVIAKACGFDDYWLEQVRRGESKAEHSLSQLGVDND